MFFMIGSALKKNEALETLKQECGEFNFPQKMTVKNHMPRDIVGAAVNLFLDSNLKINGITEREVEFPTFGHLMQVVTDIELVAKMNGFENAASLSAKSLSIPEKTEDSDNTTEENKGSRGRNSKPQITKQVKEQ